MAGNYVLLERIELNASAASVVFSNIPQTGYTDLKMVISARGANADTYTEGKLRFNGASTDTNLSSRTLMGSGTGTASFSNTYVYCGPWVGSTATANTFGNVEIYIPNYTSSSNKSISVDAVGENNAASSYQTLNAGLFASSAAITSIQILPVQAGGWLANSTFSLYGIAAVGTTPAIAPKANGGNVIGTDGTYWYHTFLSSGTFTPQVGLVCDYLVVAGGGAGGGGLGGGGGAGGVRCTVGTTGGGGSLETPLTLSSSTAYTVTIGAGGSGGVAGVNRSTSGANSTFATITSTGGGYGGGLDAGVYRSVTGGSGGGGVGAVGDEAGAAGTANQGYSGGNGFGTTSTANGAGGGGGGSNTVGANSGSATGGNGGAGITTSISGTSTTYAGGGGGGVRVSASGTAGTGSAGGGNGSSTSVNGSSATVNSGSGGGGSGGFTTYTGGNGGSGIVIIRYPIA